MFGVGIDVGHLLAREPALVGMLICGKRREGKGGVVEEVRALEPAVMARRAHPFIRFCQTLFSEHRSVRQVS